jgi:TolA-binding protein
LPPKAVNYRSNSIIYFKGDVSDKVYILNAGKVLLRYIDFETGQDINEYVKTGEFFGVKSAMGRYRREETATCVTDATVIVLDIPDFEQLAGKNIRVIMKMLQVFSNQLRRIHRRVQNLLAVDEHVNPELGLYTIGQYYLKSRQYSQAIYAFGRYLVYYPSGQYADEASRNLEAAEQALSQYGQGQGPGVNVTEPERPQKTRELSNTAQDYYNAVSLVNEEKYEAALRAFSAIVQQNSEPEYVAKSQFDVGRCLYYLKKYPDSIKTFTALIQHYPKHPDLGEAIFYVAQSNVEMGQTAKAEGLYRKLLSMTAESDTLFRKVKKAMRDLEGARS